MSIFVAPTTDTRSGHPFVMRLSVSGYTGPVFDSTGEMEEGRYGPTVRTLWQFRFSTRTSKSLITLNSTVGIGR